MHVITSLTVSESKRLIARGVARADWVKRALEQGTVAVLPGTTNGYVIEELTGGPFAKAEYVAGRTLPARFSGPKPVNTSAGLVIRRGKRLEARVDDVLPEMGAGDVLIKGANALNYERRQAGVLIGHPAGGNVGKALGTVVARRIRCLLPVGLEKSVPADLHEVAALINRDTEGKGPTLWVVPGDIFTEIEAIETLTGARAVPAGAGGIGGAEGAVWLAIFGDAPTIAAAEALLESLRGEPPFIALSAPSVELPPRGGHGGGAS
jgi:hypothetical protein